MPVKVVSGRFSGKNARHIYVDYSEVRTNYSTGKSYLISYDGNRMNNAPSWIASSEILNKPLYLPGFRMAGEWAAY